MARPFYWPARDAEGNMRNQIVPRGTITSMDPRDAAAQVSAKRLQYFDDANPKHVKALEEMRKKAEKPAVTPAK